MNAPGGHTSGRMGGYAWERRATATQGREQKPPAGQDSQPVESSNWSSARPFHLPKHVGEFVRYAAGQTLVNTTPIRLLQHINAPSKPPGTRSGSGKATMSAHSEFSLSRISCWATRGAPDGAASLACSGGRGRGGWSMISGLAELAGVPWQDAKQQGARAAGRPRGRLMGLPARSTVGGGAGVGGV